MVLHLHVEWLREVPLHELEDLLLVFDYATCARTTAEVEVEEAVRSARLKEARDLAEIPLLQTGEVNGGEGGGACTLVGVLCGVGARHIRQFMCNMEIVDWVVDVNVEIMLRFPAPFLYGSRCVRWWTMLTHLLP